MRGRARPIVTTIQTSNSMEGQSISQEFLNSILKQLQESQSTQEQHSPSIESVGSEEHVSIEQHDDDFIGIGDTSHQSWTEEMLVEEIRQMRCLWGYFMPGIQRRLEKAASMERHMFQIWCPRPRYLSRLLEINVQFILQGVCLIREVICPLCKL